MSGLIHHSFWSMLVWHRSIWFKIFSRHLLFLNLLSQSTISCQCSVFHVSPAFPNSWIWHNLWSILWCTLWSILLLFVVEELCGSVIYYLLAINSSDRQFSMRDVSVSGCIINYIASFGYFMWAIFIPFSIFRCHVMPDLH